MRAHHVGVTVADLDRAVAFYRDALGLELLDRFTLDDPDFAAAVGVEDATGRFAHLDAGGARLELVRYDPEGESHGRPELNEPGAAHVGLGVDDVRAVYDSLPDGVETLSEPRTTGSGTTICFLRDPEGNLVELLDA